MRRPAVAAVSAVVLVTGAGVAAANDWLPIFRTEQVAPVERRPRPTSSQVPDLSAYGDRRRRRRSPTRSRWPTPRPRASGHGLDVPEVAELPDGRHRGPEYQVADVVSATFTFSAEKAAQAAAAEGEALPPPPAGTRRQPAAARGRPGRRGRLVAAAPGVPTLVVARAVAPDGRLLRASRSRPSATTCSRSPACPRTSPTQLRDLSADGATLPLPVPAELVTTSTGRRRRRPRRPCSPPATALFAGVVWVEDGVMTGVAGSLSADELLSVARGLR